MSLFWALFVALVLLMLLGVLAYREWPQGETKKFRCKTPCEDRLCKRFGCPDSPEWIGDRK
jgi:hypothetical protein